MKEKMVKFISIFSMVLIGGAVGALFARYTKTCEKSKSEIIIILLFALLLFIVAIFVQTIIHEMGHMIFGMISGYQFASFRIANVMLIKKEDGFKFCKYSLVGTGGQCLMSPPDCDPKNVPYRLYNLGGVIANIILSAIAALLYFLEIGNGYFKLFCLGLLVSGIIISITNGIPMRVDGMDNDGYNALNLGKDEIARKAFCIQLKMNAKMTQGLRLRDMPTEWFFIPSEEEMKNTLAASMGVFALNYAMDCKDFERAKEIIAYVLERDDALIAIYRTILQMEHYFLELVGENREEVKSEIQTEEFLKFLPALKSLPSTNRLSYTKALFEDHDEKKAEQIKEDLLKKFKKYPYQQEVEGELELMDYALTKYKERSKGE